MAHEGTGRTDDDEEEGTLHTPPRADTAHPTPRGPFTLASLLDLNEDELAELLPRVAPMEHRWEQLTLGVAPDTGEAVPSALRSGAAELSVADGDLIPGLDVPGAVEVPVYLAGRALHDLLAGAPPVASDTSPSVLDDAAWSVVGDGDATSVPTPVRVETRRPTPKRPPALATPTNGRARRSMDPPAANFTKAESAPVLWPKRKTPVGVLVARFECARCHAAVTGETCGACGSGEKNRARRRLLRALVTAGLESDNRLARTVTALLLAPGELTVTHLAGQTRRYFGPAMVAAVALVLFAVISMTAGLRPRPDRALTIGSERTAEIASGLANRSPLNVAGEDAPGIVRDSAAMVNFVPIIWLLTAAMLVLGVVAALRAPVRRDSEAAMVFTAHAMGWFVLWWGVAVPLLLLLVRLGFEATAMAAGVQQVRYLTSGGIAGVSPAWNAARAIVTTGEFHSVLLALGIVPWLAKAWYRTFTRDWPKAVTAALVIAAIPLLLLAPFC